ncbi:uncharacterized protein LOC120685611 [Panicum virgatum]|uniref:Uncharacterized protein n=1 Tax=Panicum virgatum TaxID=38727 RepID=A0A8T0PJI7_PANVG|nr:uncharacterized protein LOC120685611 [Panicum virgatum]KAG2559305.1 hypothetical protein PVAP13_8NG311600 [Panicum virgatum]KAG2559306.1 hypothetical protein PVAP13_8NG311600 [Panicum virgatum]
MEPDAAWLPWNSQLANWSMEPSVAVWTHGLPVEYHYPATQITSCCLQTSVPTTSSTGGKLVDHHATAAATQLNDPIEKEASQELEVDLQNMVLKIHVDPIHAFEKAAHDYKAGVDLMRLKIHRYPATIRALGELYTVPTTVAIGPYHHGRDQLKPTEKVKHVAAYNCIRESGRPVQEMYDAVVHAAGSTQGLYDGDAVAGVGDDDFLPMMFYDACFLVQYMLTCTRAGLAQMDPALRSFFDANDNDVFRDITQLENQLPWRVVEAVMRFRPVPVAEFVASLRGCLQDRKVDDADEEPFALDEGFEPPHLLGLLRFYIVGRSHAKLPAVPETDAISFSVSTIELAELIHMGLKEKGNLFAELSLAPLSLDDTRTSLLANMAALELCSTSSFPDADDEESAVCSYLLLLGMIVDREEDVHELRRRRLLQGGGGLTNREALEFLARLQGLRLGSRYVRTMEEIESYKLEQRTRTKVHAFVYRNMKTMIVALSAIAAVVGIVGTLKSLKVVH